MALASHLLFGKMAANVGRQMWVDGERVDLVCLVPGASPTLHPALGTSRYEISKLPHAENPAKDAGSLNLTTLCRRSPARSPQTMQTDRLYTPGKVALGILGLRTHPSLRFLGLGGSSTTTTTNDERTGAEERIDSIWEEDEDAAEEDIEEEGGGGRWQTAATNGETDGDGEHDDSDGDDEGSSGSSGSTFAAGAEAAVRSTISKVGGEWTRFTQDVSEATEGLLAAVNKAGTSVGDAADAVAEATSGVRGMSSEEFALTALLLKQLAAGGGPTPDQVLQLVQKCEREGARPQEGVPCSSETMSVGDLIIPGHVRWTRGGCGSMLLPRTWRLCNVLLGTERRMTRGLWVIAR